MGGMRKMTNNKKHTQDKNTRRLSSLCQSPRTALDKFKAPLVMARSGSAQFTATKGEA